MKSLLYEISTNPGSSPSPRPHPDFIKKKRKKLEENFKSFKTPKPSISCDDDSTKLYSNKNPTPQPDFIEKRGNKLNTTKNSLFNDDYEKKLKAYRNRLLWIKSSGKNKINKPLCKVSKDLYPNITIREVANPYEKLNDGFNGVTEKVNTDDECGTTMSTPAIVIPVNGHEIEKAKTIDDNDICFATNTIDLNENRHKTEKAKTNKEKHVDGRYLEFLGSELFTIADDTLINIGTPVNISTPDKRKRHLEASMIKEKSRKTSDHENNLSSNFNATGRTIFNIEGTVTASPSAVGTFLPSSKNLETCSKEKEKYQEYLEIRREFPTTIDYTRSSVIDVDDSSNIPTININTFKRKKLKATKIGEKKYIYKKVSKHSKKLSLQPAANDKFVYNSETFVTTSSSTTSTTHTHNNKVEKAGTIPVDNNIFAQPILKHENVVSNCDITSGDIIHTCKRTKSTNFPSEGNDYFHEKISEPIKDLSSITTTAGATTSIVSKISNQSNDYKSSLCKNHFERKKSNEIKPKENEKYADRKISNQDKELTAAINTTIISTTTNNTSISTTTNSATYSVTSASTSAIPTTSVKRKSKPRTNSCNSERYFDQGFSPVPQNGFYFVTNEIIKECPNCYESIDPQDLIFNIKNSKVSTWCKACYLQIFFLLNFFDTIKS